MATATKTRPTSTTRRTVRKATTKARRFDSTESDNWYTIASKGQMFALAIAAFNGAKFPGSEILCDRAKAKETLTAAKENGFLD